VDYHRDSSNSVATRFFRSEHKSKVPANRQLDSHSDRYRRHTCHIEPAWGDINSSRTRSAPLFHSASSLSKRELDHA